MVPISAPWAFGWSKRWTTFPKEQHNPSRALMMSLFFKKHKDPARKTRTKPFFHVVLTSPATSPFETPRPKKIKGKWRAQPFYNAHCWHRWLPQKPIYTICKKPVCGTIPSWSSWRPRPPPTYYQSKIEDFAIPMIWLAAPLTPPSTKQGPPPKLDLMPTLLAQLGLDAVILPRQKRLVCPGAGGPFAFNNGIGYE